MDLQPDGRRKYPRSTLLKSSADRGWSTASAELRSHPPGRISSLIQRNVEVVVAIRGTETGEVERIAPGRQQSSDAASGTVWLVPADVGNEEITISGPIPAALHLYLPAEQFNLLARQYGFARSPANSIQYLGGLNDEFIYQIGLAILSELTRETATGRMLAETAFLMLAARLAHNYSDGSFLQPDASTTYRLDSVRLRRVLDYIDQHIEQEISVGDLAGVANLSVFHFARMFAVTVGLAPYRYVSRRRLEHAMVLLATAGLPLSEIAHKSCFSSQANFNRAFRRATGMTPGEYRRSLGRTADRSFEEPQAQRTL